MDTPIIVAIITVSGSLVVASLTFYLTKRYELKSKWQQEKLAHYKELLMALSSLAVDGSDKNGANIRFAHAVNTIALVAPQYVVEALMDLHDEVKYNNPNRSLKNEQRLIIELMLAIRKDIGLTKKDNPLTFDFHLIGAAPKK
jgi:hypothetical protein